MEIQRMLMEVFQTEEIAFLRAALLRVLAASVCGGLIGLERELKGRPAGLKTFSLVCIGAALAMVTNEYIARMSGGNEDLARMAAQVISGIGFLGAGTIIVTGTNQIRGLTTAAALWVTAALGICIGAGFYTGAFGSIGIILLSSMVCRMIDRLVAGKSRILKLYVEGVNEEFMLVLIDYLESSGIRIRNVTRRSENKWYKKDTCVMAELDLGCRRCHREVINSIRQLKGLRYVEEI